VVITDIGENSHIIKDGVNGFLAADTQDWRNRLEALIEDAALRKSMGEAAARLIREEYSLEVCGRRMAGLIKGLFRPVT